MIKATVSGTLRFPKLNFQEDLRFVAERIFIPILQNNIKEQVSINGSPFPALEPSTIARKNNITFERLKRTENKLSHDHYTQIAGYGKQLSESKKSFNEITTALSGIDSKILIQTGKLIKSFRFKNYGKSAVIIYLDSSRAEIGKYLQIDGMGKKKKHFNFFGINAQMEQNGIAYMKQKIKDTIDAFRK